MPKEIFHRDFQYLDRSALLDFDEIERIARSFAHHGVTKLRLTGGEPLLRRGLEDLIARLAAIPGIDDLAMTTNGALLERKASRLAAAGLRRVTVSLDSLDDAVFMAMNDVGFSAHQVLDGIAAAAEAGLGPIKINMVVKRGVNDASVVDMARHFKDAGHTLRFIEYMDVGSTNGWRLDDVVTAASIVDVLLGDSEPGGRMPTTWARRDEDTPSFDHYPGSNGIVRYAEGIFVGYRGYDRSNTEPLIPFGHGGSYTTFDWGPPILTGQGTDLRVDLPITNSGTRAGSEVVQVYVSPRQPVVERPSKELAGFAKVHLEPGGTAQATVRLRDRSFARWDTTAQSWKVDPGEYDLLFAASAADVRHSVMITLP